MRTLGHFELMALQVVLIQRSTPPGTVLRAGIEFCQPFLRVEAANDEGGPPAAA